MDILSHIYAREVLRKCLSQFPQHLPLYTTSTRRARGGGSFFPQILPSVKGSVPSSSPAGWRGKQTSGASEKPASRVTSFLSFVITSRY